MGKVRREKLWIHGLLAADPDGRPCPARVVLNRHRQLALYRRRWERLPVGEDKVVGATAELESLLEVQWTQVVGMELGDDCGCVVIGLVMVGKGSEAEAVQVLVI